MMIVDNFEDLKIWQEAKKLCISIYSITKRNQDFGFNNQIQRAAVSIMNNIAEGFESGTSKSLVKYFQIAKGSAAEVRSMLILGIELGYFTKESTSLIEKGIYITKGIQKFINKKQESGQ